MNTVNLSPTQLQLKSLAKGKTVQLKYNQINGGPHTFVVDQIIHKRILNARRKETGVRLQLSREQIGKNPFLMAIAGFVADKVISGAYKGVKKLVTGHGHSGPSPKQLDNLRRGREKMMANRLKKKKGSGLRLPGN